MRRPRLIRAVRRSATRRGRATGLAGALVALVGCVVVAVALGSPGQPGTVDTGFGNQGTVTFGSGRAANITSFAAQVVQPDGKLVMVGTSNPSTGNTQMGSRAPESRRERRHYVWHGTTTAWC